MVTHNMLRMHEGIQVFSDKKYSICDRSRTNQKPYTGLITEITPCMRNYLWVSLQYKYHVINLNNHEIHYWNTEIQLVDSDICVFQLLFNPDLVQNWKNRAMNHTDPNVQHKPE